MNVKESFMYHLTKAIFLLAVRLYVLLPVYLQNLLLTELYAFIARQSQAFFFRSDFEEKVN